MEDSVKEAAKILDQTEKDLLTSVTLNDPAHSELDLPLAKFRSACVNLYFLDLQIATSINVEARLWAAHGRVNSQFRSHLATLREKAAKKKFVERRKGEELYKAFLKSSVAFYRGFIQRLAANFKDVPEIFNIARGFGLDPLSVNTPSDVSLEQKQALLRSCHATLIRLGDLSRYRETEIPKNSNKRNWGPAVGYYDLAGTLMADDGQAFNQRAVISLANNDHLRAVYHLYRALTVKRPPEPARGNLELEFKKIRNRHARQEPLFPVDTTSLDLEFETLFLTFHARCYGDQHFQEHEQQCLIIVTSLAQALADNAYDSAAKKMCLINIAGSHYAEQRAREAVEQDPTRALVYFKAYEMLQDLNILTFIMLLQLVVKDLKPILVEGVGEMDQASCIARVTPLCRRILPHLRLYSSWLLTKAGFLLESQDEERHRNLPRLWESYADTLNVLLNAFPTKHLPDGPYLLDEDQETRAFIAFSEKAKDRRLLDITGKPKPTRSDAQTAAAQRPEMEMLMRIKDLVRDGVYFSRNLNAFGSKPIPLAFSEMRFVFVGEVSKDSRRHLHEVSGESLSSATIHDTTSIANGIHAQRVHGGRSRTDDLENMVDDLVGPVSMAVETPYSFQPQSPAVSGSPSLSRPDSGPLRASDLFGHIQQASPALSSASPALISSHRISIPGAWKTPFTPRLGESNGSSPRPGTSHQANGSTATPPGVRLPPSPNELAFNHEIAQIHQNIQNRSSPMKAFDPAVTPVSLYQTPTGYDGFILQDGSENVNSSPWANSVDTTSTAGMEVPRQVAQASPYGAIGDTRRKNANTPTSGQPG